MRAMSRACAAAIIALMSTPALADPKDDMCKFVEILARDGVPAAIAFAEELAELWAPETRAKLGVVVGSELEKFDYRGGQVYQTANLPGAIEEFLLTLNLTGSGSVYLRVLYEGNGRGPLSFINIDFQASYYDAIERQLLQSPKVVACPDG